SRLRSSPRARQIKRDWVCRYRSLRRKIPLLGFAQTKKLARQLYPEWGSSIWKLSSIDCCGNSTSERMSESLRSPTKKQSARPSSKKGGSFVKAVVGGSTATSGLKSNR